MGLCWSSAWPGPEARACYTFQVNQWWETGLVAIQCRLLENNQSFSTMGPSSKASIEDRKRRTRHNGAA